MEWSAEFAPVLNFGLDSQTTAETDSVAAPALEHFAESAIA
jgi:hypothetical protein